MRIRIRESGDVFAFFKHEENPQSPNWAMELLNSGKPN